MTRTPFSVVVSDSATPQTVEPTGLLCPWDSIGKNTGVGCHFLLQGIFLTQGLNLGLLHWQADALLSVAVALMASYCFCIYKVS